jgi:hypothetical protein
MEGEALTGTLPAEPLITIDLVAGGLPPPPELLPPPPPQPVRVKAVIAIAEAIKERALLILLRKEKLSAQAVLSLSLGGERFVYGLRYHRKLLLWDLSKLTFISRLTAIIVAR